MQGMLEIIAGYEHLAGYANSAIARATAKQEMVAPVSTDIYLSSNGDRW
jgi:hypothetical protein